MPFRVIIRWAMASGDPNVNTLREFTRNVEIASLHSSSALGSVTENVTVGKGTRKGTKGGQSAGTGRQSASSGTGKGPKGKGKIQDPNQILAKFYIPVEDSYEAAGSVIKKILISKISMCSL